MTDPRNGFVAALEQMARESMTPVEANGVGAQHPLHARDQVRLRGVNLQMEVVAHEHPTHHFPSTPHAGFFQHLQKNPCGLHHLQKFAPAGLLGS